MKILNYILFPLRAIAWLVALPLRVVAQVVEKKRVYDPEKTPCPCCGYRGERSSDFKSCVLNCELIPKGPLKTAMLRHMCLRCTAYYYTDPVLESVKWVK